VVEATQMLLRFACVYY